MKKKNCFLMKLSAIVARISRRRKNANKFNGYYSINKPSYNNNRSELKKSFLAAEKSVHTRFWIASGLEADCMFSYV